MSTDRIAGAAIAAVGLYVAWAARAYPFGTLAEPGPGLLPLVLALIFAALGLVLVLSGGIRGERGVVSFSDLPHALVILAALSACAFGMERIGYRALVVALLLFFLVLVERRNVYISLTVAALVSFGTYYLISDVLRVSLPLGPWGY